jgi:hypothetical protein
VPYAGNDSVWPGLVGYGADAIISLRLWVGEV